MQAVSEDFEHISGNLDPITSNGLRNVTIFFKSSEAWPNRIVFKIYPTNKNIIFNVKIHRSFDLSSL